MSSELIEFFNVIFRYIHVIAAIMWIGNSLLFTWMEINFVKDPKKGDDSLGEMNMLHAGGVYFLEKRVIDPNNIPPKLHVFKWQSYTTWISGFILLIAIFYSRPGTLMLDPSKSDMLGWQATAISLASLVLAWFTYDLLLKTPLRKNTVAVMATAALILLGYVLWIDQFFSNRFVYLQVGAMLGTIMSANVRFVIIPNQKKIMDNLKAGRPHDLEIGRQAKLRSLTNHYVTFPVIFLMLSAHFPSLYGDPYYIAIAGVVVVALIIIKWMMNLYNTFSEWLYVAFAALILGCSAVFGLKYVSANASGGGGPALAMDDPIRLGKELYQSSGCMACHQPMDSSIAPTLHGIYGTERQLASGETAVADDAYLEESILYSKAKVTKGYAAAMPGYETVFDEEEVAHLIAYIRSL
ncbi:MAG: c-type cytochrome [Verrucomicrobia bacterium]|jgi:uncharacterized membrane protein|nr:c-type cytochrome [Verrucomicrobiota bacterium]